MGIEPTSEAWEASILPLYDARSYLRFYLQTYPKRNSSRDMRADESVSRDTIGFFSYLSK
jgi:hypothetical protein